MSIPKVRKSNLWLSSLIFIAALSICAAINISNSFANTNIKDLDIALQYKMSEEMAKENPAFHFKKQGQIYEAERFANGLKGTVTPNGVTFTMGTAEWSLSLEKVMSSDKTLQFNRTEAMQAVSMNKNRLELKNQKITEWFVNGLQGFQQGWTIPKPLSDTQDILTLSFASKGNVAADVMEDKRGINLQDSKGNTVFSYGGLYAYDAKGKELPVWFEQKDKSIQIQVNDAGATYPVVIDPLIFARLTASDGSAGDPPNSNSADQLGSFVAISADGNTVVAGATYADLDGEVDAGAVYVFAKGGAWATGTQTAKLYPPKYNLDLNGYKANYNMPFAVAISEDGSTIAIGVPQADDLIAPLHTQSGCIYVFNKSLGNNAAWEDGYLDYQDTIVSPVQQDIGQFGGSVAIATYPAEQKTIIIAGAKMENSNGEQSGGAYVFTKVGAGNWGHAYTLIANDVAADDWYGASVAISPDSTTIAVGACGAAISGKTSAGAVYIFQGQAGLGLQPGLKAKIYPTDSDESMSFSGGWHGSISITQNGNTITVGCQTQKAVYVFYKDDADWNAITGDSQQIAKLTASDGGTLQYSAITSDGSRIVSGAADKKKIYAFSIGGGWQNGSVNQTMSHGDADVSFGNAVGISSDGLTIVAGASGATAGAGGTQVNAGAVHVIPYYESYGVTYDGNGSDGGSVPTDPGSPYASGAEVTVLGNTGTLTKTGATFAGWNTLANGNGTNYAAAAKFNIAANTTLYAKWTPITYTVTYDGNGSDGGLVPTDATAYADSDEVTVLGEGTLTKTNSTFAGWNTAANGSGDSYSEGDPFTISANTTLYAQWTAAGPTGDWITNGTPSVWTQGDGSQSSPWLIENAQTLAYLAQQVNAGTTYNGKYFKLNADIDLTDHYWIPIANVDPRSFQGYFDGNNKTVSNVKIGTALSPITDVGYYGLFGRTGWANAEIKNLTVSDVAIYVNAWASIGGLIGDNQGIIDNCSVSGTVGIGTTVFQLNAGGLAGVNGNKIRNSFSTVNIVRSGAANNGRAGGLVGRNYKASTNTAGQIENCFAAGNVEAGHTAGGLVGWNWADNVSLTPTVINSYATGNVLANTYVGGSVGWHYIENGASILVDTTYWNSDAVQTLNGGAQNPKKGIGDGTGTTTGLTAAQMSSAAGQASALVDTLNTNKGSTHPTWYSWVQAGGVNNGYPTQSLIAPTTQSTNITFSTVQSTQMQIGWTNGNGGNRAVFVKQADAGTATPVNNTTYTANTAFSSGTQIVATGWYCVYNGTGTSVTVTGLLAGTDYIAQVFEYNGSTGSEKYLASDAANNPKNQTTILILAPSVTTQRLPEWTETTPTGVAENKDWSCTAISSDGETMLAGGWPGRVYLSTNSGVGWTDKLIAGDTDSIWYTVSMSPLPNDGIKMLAGSEFRLYLSTDSGTTWGQANTPVKDQNKQWYTSAISSDGTTMLAGVMNGRLYVSTNSGTAWTEIQPAGNTDQLWDNVAISANGTRMLAGIQNGLLYVSTNSGTSWDETTPTGSSVNAETWRCIAISGDGSKMLAGLNNGRIYISTNNGSSWSQTAPTGVLEDKAWKRASISSDGQKMIVVLDGGTVYISTNGGTSWAETRPAGTSGANWMDVDISSDGTKALIPVGLGGRVYLGEIPTTLFVPTNITVSSATVPGTITNLNGGSNATTRGVIYYTTDADKVLADVDNNAVKKVSEGNGSGDYATADFTMALSALSPNIQYFYRSYATNDNGDGYGPRASFWTLANTPSAPTVNNPTVTTLDVTINVNANPASTTFAIQETSTGNYVWSDGSLGGTSPDWQNAADWGAVSGTSGKITVTGLTPGATYTFQVKAKNGGGTATVFGGTASGVPAATPSVATTGAAWVAPIADSRDWVSTAISSNGSKMLGAVYGGRVYLSTDSGANWTETQPDGNSNYDWQSVAMSSDGNTMAAAVYGGSVYVSTDGGTNWSDSGLSSSYWYSVSISSDGSVMLASAEEGRVYFSIDSGANWNETQPIDDSDYYWYSTAISSDGSKMLTGAYGEKLYLSTDTGASWNPMSPPTATRDWYVAMSPDGMTMLAGEYRGRLYLSTNGGTSWSETRPTGIDETKKWIPLSISADGTKMLAGVYSTSPNRLYLSTNQGVTWSETRPTGIDEDNYWQAVSISSDGSRMMAAVNGGRLYCGSFSSVTNIAATSATAPGNITASNGAAITARGMIYYPYTGGDKVIGGVDVTQVAGSGPFGTGAFTIGLTGLSGNTRYNVRAYATNSVGTTYGNTADFWTLAIVPAAPTVNNPTATTLDVTIGANGNSAGTEFAIYETGTSQYVQANGTLGASAVWQNVATWGTVSTVSGKITVTGLTTGTPYTFEVKARDGGNTETAYSTTASGTAVSLPTVATEGELTWAETMPTGTGADKDWISSAISSDGSKMLTCVYNGRIYLYSNSAWSEIQPAGNGERAWRSVSMSSDGTKMLASVYSGSTNGRLYISTDSGASWSEATTPVSGTDKTWMFTAMSPNGQYMLAGVSFGRVYRSINSGADWAEIQPNGSNNFNWRVGAISNDGTKILAGIQTGLMFFSTNSGGAWTNPASLPNTGVIWNTISMSDDASKILVPVYNGRIYLSTNSGGLFNEIQPAGNGDQVWASTSLSSDGTKMLACVTSNKVYFSQNSGTDWTETRPTGLDENKGWQTVSISGDGTKMLAGIYGGRIYYRTKPVITNIASTSATAYGNITATNGANATTRGVIYYPYTNTDEELLGAGVVDVPETGGSYGAVVFTRSLTGLTSNTRYNVRAYATNTGGTGYGTRTDFWTLASVPTAPTVNTPTATTLNVTVNVNGNPASTEFSINETSTNTHVQANGTLAAGEVWQNAATWGTKTLTGLTTGNTYTFKVKARNGGSTETAYGATASGTPASTPTVTTQAVSVIAATTATGNGNITATNGANATNRGVIWYPYTDTDKVIGGTDVTDVSANGDYGTGAFTASLIGLTPNTQYNARAHATTPNGTGYGTRVDFWTLANVPSAPTVSNATATTLDVTVNVNSNPASTTFAIHATATGVDKYVQADGTLGDSTVWQSAATWGTVSTVSGKITVTGLTTGTSYTFEVKAKNGNGTETAYSTTASGTPNTPYIPPPVVDPPVTPPMITTDTQVVTSGTVGNTGTYEDVVINTETTVTNSGTLIDLDNSGTINGGVVAGDSVNDGVMNNVTLPEETALDNAGGTLSNAANAGEVFGGTIEGTVTNTGVISGTAPDGTIDASYAVTIESGATVSGGEVAGAIVNNGVLDNVTIDNNAVISFGNSGQITGSITVVDEEGVACVISIPSNIVYPDPESLAQGFVLTPQAIRAYAKENNWDVKIEERTARLQRNSFAASSTLPQIPSYYYLIDGVVFSETGSKSTQEIEMVVPFNPDNVPSVIDTSDMIVLVYDYESKNWKNIPHTLSGNNVKIKTDLVSAVAIAAEADLLVSVTTDQISGISHISAASCGTVVSEGGSTISAKGVCWNNSINPTIENNKTDEGTGAGSFKSILTKLSPNTKYYVRAYVTSELGTIYGSEYSFTTATGLVNSYLTLTDKTLAAFTIPTNADMNMFGVSVGKSIKIKQGSQVAFNYFVADNKVVLEESAYQFRVYRSGAAVYLVSIMGTVIKIPGTLTAQSIYFSDGRADLVIYGNKVMLGEQEITLSANKLSTLSNSEKYVDTQSSQLASTVDSYLILTNSSPAFTIPYGAYTQVFGSSGINIVSVEKGAKVDCENFAGANVVNIAEPFTAFNVWRKGATVYFESQNGTYIEIPVTTTFQTLTFQDNSYKLAIVDSQIMLIKMIIDKDKSKVDDVIVISDSAKR